MTILDVVLNFRDGATKGEASGGRVRIEGQYLYNYRTIIAKRTAEGIELNVKKYSRTTSKLQNKLKANCNVIKEYSGPDANIYYCW